MPLSPVFAAISALSAFLFFRIVAGHGRFERCIVQAQAIQNLIVVVPRRLLGIPRELIGISPLEMDRSASVSVEKRMLADVVESLPVVGHYLDGLRKRTGWV